MATFTPLNVTVTTAGTSVQVSATTLMVKKAIIVGFPSNTGNIYIGNASGDNRTVGFGLKVNQNAIVIGDIEIMGKDDYIDLSKMWVDVSVSGEKISIMYIQ